MVENCEPWNTLENFLMGVFHQDAGPPDVALEEYVAEVTEWDIQCDIKLISEYLNSDVPESAKNEFIASRAEIYFPYIGMTPVEWLAGVLSRLKKALEEDKP